MLVCLGGLVTFVGVVGPDPSVLRAALMGALGTIALVSGRPRRVSALMNISIVLLVIGDPWLAADFAFILSVLATFGLYLMGGHCASWLSRWFPFSLAQLLAIPLVAQLFCSPVIVLLQPQLTPYAVLANVAAAPVVAFVTVLGTLGMSIAWLWPTVAVPLALLSGVGSWWVALVARGISGWPGATFPWPDGWRGAVLMALVNSVVVAGLAHCSDPQKTAVTLAKIRHRMGPRFRPLMTFPFLTAACAVLLGVGIILLNPG